MKPQQETPPKGVLQAENIGGIRETTVEFSPGITVLVGRNATNRTSFLQAVMAALGSENVAVKGDADGASASLTLGDETYTRQLRRRSDGLVTDGDPYLDDSELADLFAFLLESNEARRAVAAHDDLRDLIMRPIDTATIQSEIAGLVEKRESLRRELDEIDDVKGDLPELEETRCRLTREIDEKRSELEAKEAELEATDADVEETREEQSELADRLEELRTKRSQLEDVRYDLDTERESLETFTQEQRELETERVALPEPPADEVDELDSEMERLRERKQANETAVNELQSVIGFNEGMLQEADSNTLDGFAGKSSGEVTDQLLPDETVTCWTCGSDVDREQIESTIEQLRELSRTKLSTVSELDDEISELQAVKRDHEEGQRERDRIKRRLAELDTEIERGEHTIEDLQDRREALTAEIESIEAAVEELEDTEDSRVLDLHKEANQLEYELGALENDLERVEAEIDEFEGQIETEADVQAHLSEVENEIENLRTKIERLEATAIDEFNEHMDTVLELLDYANLERIWIERVQRTGPEGRQTASKRVFELHVTRRSESGAVYEDTVDHLSESEREVTGLVFALAGYLAHDLHETVPFILLDSLEAIDSERIATLVEYLNGYTDYLLVALLPADAAALSDGYERVSEI